jgi:hypothetical protein
MGLAVAGFVGHAVLFSSFSPSLFEHISTCTSPVSGFMAATGVAVILLVAFGVRRGELWAWVDAAGR